MDVVLPKWGMSMQDAVVAQWHVAVGDAVTEGQTLATVETDKVDAAVEAPCAGTVVELLASAGDTVDVGSTIARID
jgi:pyruvate/2-oxoglutarate dehydrogenase complex dihydrolipoamide acyltransferase (E2) component